MLKWQYNLSIATEPNERWSYASPSRSIEHFTERQFGLSFFLGGGGSMGSGLPFSPRPGASIKSDYYIGKGRNLQLNSELVNYDPVDKEIYLTIDVEWSREKDPSMFDVGDGAIPADRCDDKEQAVHQPPKDRPITYKGEPGTVIGDGYLLISVLISMTVASRSQFM
jgi:hypothetical protein